MKLSRYFIIVFGCQMNVRDGARMQGILHEKGLAAAEKMEEADLILVMSCTVREKPERKALSVVGRICKDKKNKPDLILGMCGCVSQQYGRELLDRFPNLNFVLGTNQVAMLGEVLDQAASGQRICRTEWVEDNQSEIRFRISPEQPVSGVRQFVTIMEGCDNYCAYCVVPYVRGPELSRRPEDIISELESLSGRGVKEVVLLGQNVNSYGMKNGFGMDFPELLRKAAKVDGLERIRFTTNHPKDLSDRLIAAMAEEDKVCEQIHMPLQAGSDRVLGLMGRGYTGEQYLGLARKLRAAMPEVGIGTDLIVGFPGETEEDFERTLELCRELEFDEAFTFRYCSRPMTRAAGYADQVAEEVKLERLYRLEKLVSEITEQKNRASAGRVKEILVEGESRNDRERLTGRTREGRLAHIARAGHEHLKGELVWVKIDRGLKHSLLGEALEAGKGKESLQGEKPCSFR